MKQILLTDEQIIDLKSFLNRCQIGTYGNTIGESSTFTKIIACIDNAKDLKDDDND
jgi:hypothetical protein